MSDCMPIPDNWKDFVKEYSFKDIREVYTNGSQLIPTFRVEQMMEHYHHEWVSVKDRLPPVHFNVLVWCGKDKYHCDQYHIARIDKYGCWYTVDRLGGCDPIFWCLLPEPPKENEQ